MRASIETSRLSLRWLSAGDADFIKRLLNDADWIRFIGDNNVTSPEQARVYIASGPCAMYRQHGFGLNRVALKESDTPIGICGLLQRETLQYSDLGFAFLPGFRRQRGMRMKPRTRYCRMDSRPSIWRASALF
jgi:RimJ/RimL family protein N-acetyltransferase